MKKITTLKCKIADIAYYLPLNIIDNGVLSARYEGWCANKIYEKTGIRQRHLINENEHVSDLAVNAAKELFKKGIVSPEEIDALILCTQTPDYALPASSFLVHERLGLPKKCATLDFNQGCSGFVYGLSIVGSMINSRLIKKALLITSEAYSKWCHPMDKSVSTIFGDGAAAVYIRAIEKEQGVGPFLFGTDGKGFKNLTVPFSGSHKIKTDDNKLIETKDLSGNIRSPENLYMNGPELFRFAITEVPNLVEGIFQVAGINMSNVDKFVFHQANLYMLKSIQKRLNIPHKKMIYEIEDIGNTVSSSIPIALCRAYEKNNISIGDKLMLVGFGVGYSWAGTILTWNPDEKKHNNSSN